MRPIVLAACAALSLLAPTISAQRAKPTPERSGVAANERFVYVLRGDWLLQYDAESLTLRRRVRLPVAADAEIAEEPVLQDTEIEEVEAIEQVEEIEEVEESAFDPSAWNTAIGLGGGAGGKYGLRGAGRRGLGAKGGKATAAAIERALEWLKTHQDEDGHWDADGFMKHDVEGAACDGAGQAVHDVGVTGLALLAFLGDGSTLRTGPYRNVVKKGIAWLRRQQDQQTGLFGSNAANSFIYDHAIATLAMSEAYGLSQYKLLERPAQRGIDYLEAHRNPYAVWRYQPRDNENDTSVTSWCVMAYRAAQDFGLVVNENALKLAEGWLDQMTDPVNGRTGYNDRGGLSSRPAGKRGARYPRELGEGMTAAGLFCRYLLGQEPESTSIMRRQADLVVAKPPRWEDGAIDHCSWFFGTYAMYQTGGRHWRTWSRQLTKAVVEPQRTDGNFQGSWDPDGVWGDEGGRVYSTALLALTLEAYYRYARLAR